MSSVSLCWLRRDLRLQDNTALCRALQSGGLVQCVFVFDTRILSELASDDRRLAFIWLALQQLQAELTALGGSLWVLQGDPVAVIPALARQLSAGEVYANRDYEPYARGRDEQVSQGLVEEGRRLLLFKDQVIFEQDELLTAAGKPYTVFTPYCKTWLRMVTPAHTACWEAVCRGRLRVGAAPALPSLAELGFAEAQVDVGKMPIGSVGAQQLLVDFQHRMPRYHLQRDYPAVKGVSYLSTHLRFGTVSIRQLVGLALADGGEGAICWLKELIWREFYQQLLWHFPQVVEQSFKPQYVDLAFPNDPVYLQCWQQGKTGYPIIDAAMRQLNQTGYMHNRLRMVVASFLVKDLLVDWRLGERYFAQQLLDFDLAANNGGWQWAASTGCDAQPYFRIFNPLSQSQRFDPKGKFLRRYLPELAELDNKAIHAPCLAKQLPAGFSLGRDYPWPIVDHAQQREKALALFARA
ncbi:DNA photolyase family protein [Neisseriaceae bacterium TC5R-5]|nr:DNA photolyase family protein [Neisseriaceae bacterium TC5R-5]